MTDRVGLDVGADHAGAEVAGLVRGDEVGGEGHGGWWVGGVLIVRCWIGGWVIVREVYSVREVGNGSSR